MATAPEMNRGESEGATLLHKCMTKATTAEGDNLRYSHNWIVSRRAILQVWSDRLVCGDWVVSYADIRAAELTSFRSTFFIPGYVLRIRTEKLTYQFGLNGGKFWRGDLPFPVTRGKGRLSYSLFSLAIRLFLIGYIIHSIWKYIQQP